MLIALDREKRLFRDAAAYQEFIELFRNAVAANSMPLVLVENEVLFTALSPASTQQLLSERILKRLSENPALIDELRHRLEEDIVE